MIKVLVRSHWVIRSVLFIGMILSFSTISNAQLEKRTGIWTIQTKDGNQYTGPIIYENTVTLIMNTSMIKRLTIRKKNIVSLEEVKANRVKKGIYWPENVQSSSYLIGPSAFNLKKGKGYYNNNWVFWNQFDFGITDKASVGIGMLPLVGFNDENSPVWLTTKVQIPTNQPNFRLVGGTLFTNSLNVETRSRIFISGSAYLLGTLGNSDNNTSFGIGYGKGEGRWFNRPMIYWSGMFRLSEKNYLIAELFLSNPSFDFRRTAFFGGRTQWGRAAFKYCIIFNRSADDNSILDVFPWLGFTVPLR